jgi:DNA-binding GntR family transcriptional regulator
VLRSLRLLRDEGLLEFRRGRGISVAGTPERGAVVQRTRELVAFARSQGYRLDELVEIIEDVAVITPSGSLYGSLSIGPLMRSPRMLP